MKYLVLIAVLVPVSGLFGMEHQEKAKQLQKLREMNEKVARLPVESHEQEPGIEKIKLERKAPVPVRHASFTTSLNLITDYADRQYANLDQLYKEAVEVITMHSEQRDERMVGALEQQASTIENLTVLLKRLMSNGSRLERRMGVQEQNVEEFKEGIDERLGRLFDAAGDSAEMIVKQNGVIRELMRRVEKLTHKNSDQARKLALHSMAIKKLQAAVDELTEQHTDEQLDGLLEYFGDVLQGLPDLKEAPAVPETVSDEELKRQIFGDEVKKDKEEMETIIIEEYEEE